MGADPAYDKTVAGLQGADPAHEIPHMIRTPRACASCCLGTSASRPVSVCSERRIGPYAEPEASSSCWLWLPITA